MFVSLTWLETPNQVFFVTSRKYYHIIPVVVQGHVNRVNSGWFGSGTYSSCCVRVLSIVCTSRTTAIAHNMNITSANLLGFTGRIIFCIIIIITVPSVTLAFSERLYDNLNCFIFATYINDFTQLYPMLRKWPHLPTLICV